MADKVPRTERSWLSSCEGEGGERSPSNRPQTAPARSRLGWRIRARLEHHLVMMAGELLVKSLSGHGGSGLSKAPRATFAEADSGRTKTAWPIERPQGIGGRDEKASDPAVLRSEPREHPSRSRAPDVLPSDEASPPDPDIPFLAKTDRDGRAPS